MPTLPTSLLAGLLLAAASTPTAAATGKLPLAGGVSSIDGAAGGGLTPWAVIGSQATAGPSGATAFATRLATGDDRLTAAGVALG